MVFLDEPTSGLDSFSAVQVCQVLKKVANAGASVLFTIHQPSSEIFASFDHLILLDKGRVLYNGSVSDVPSYFGERGYPCPNNFNPADWIVHVAQKYPPQLLEDHGFFPVDDREMFDASVPGKGEDVFGEPIVKRSKLDEERSPGWLTQTKLLFFRELIHIYRFPLPAQTRYGLTLFLSILIGGIFYGVGETSTADAFNLQSQFGALMVLLCFTILGTAQPAILFFPEERPIFLREYSTDHYSVLSYFFSRLCLEVTYTSTQVLIMNVIIHPMVSFDASIWIYFLITFVVALSGTALSVMLGVISGGNPKVAQQLLPLIFLPQILFSGFFVSPSLIPSFLRWIQYLCVLTYGVRILAIEEFFYCSDNPLELSNCRLLLNNIEANPDDVWWYWLIVMAQFVFFRSVALVLLRKSATKFY
jgi:hypothetical protein